MSKRIKRDWSAALCKKDPPVCRNCKRIDRGVELAHTIGRKYDTKDRKVLPESVIPLCSVCHKLFDAHKLNIMPIVWPEEWAWAVSIIGEERAKKRLSGGI